jgi:hypothetical protein
MHESNIYAEQCIVSRGCMIVLRSRMRGWKPITVDEIYVILALLMLMGIAQKPALRSFI